MLRVILLLSLIVILPACARVELASHVAKQIPIAERNQPVGHFKVGRPYRIAGKTYKPQETYNFTQKGVASWYGPNFHGKLTANGEIFDKFELTAAHKTLQLPSMIRVTNLENGRSVVLRVNDRGPFSKGRILDVSERAAELLDFKHKGTARVKIQVLDKESRNLTQMAKAGQDTRGTEIPYNEKKAGSQQFAQTPAASPSPTAAQKPNAGIFVQAGSFGNQNNAFAFAQKLKTYGNAKIHPVSVNGAQHYRVRFGPLNSAVQADSLASQLASADIGEPIIVVE